MICEQFQKYGALTPNKTKRRRCRGKRFEIFELSQTRFEVHPTATAKVLVNKAEQVEYVHRTTQTEHLSFIFTKDYEARGPFFS